MTTITEQKIDEKFTVIETLRRKRKKADEILHMQILEQDIQRFLLEKITNESAPHFHEVQGQCKPFALYPNQETKELGVLGGQVTSCTYSNKEKDEVHVFGLGGTFQQQAEGFWKVMDPEKGFLDIHFVWYTGPRSKTGKALFQRGHYEGPEMLMFRFSFRLRRESSSSDTVLLYNLKIIKEEWRRTDKQELIIE